MTTAEKVMCSRCARELGPRDIALAGGFASCTHCHGLFLMPKNVAWAPDELAYHSDPVRSAPGVRVSRVVRAPDDAYRGSGATALPVEALSITWRPSPYRWLLALLVPPACLIGGFFASIGRTSSPMSAIIGLLTPLVLAVAFTAAMLMKERRARPSIQIRSEVGAGPRLVARGDVTADVEASEVQSIDVERYAAPLDIRYRGVRVGPKTIGKYAVVARVEGHSVRLASFGSASRAMYVGAELREALGLEGAGTRQRVAVIDLAEARAVSSMREEGLANPETIAEAEAEAEAEADVVDRPPRAGSL